MKKNRFLIAATIAAAGCVPDDGTPAEPSSPDAAEMPSLEAQVNRYAAAIADGDEKALRELLSSEVLGKIAHYEGGMPHFIAKQKAAMLKTFNVQSFEELRGTFQVSDLQRQATEATLAIKVRGADIGKRWTLVRESGGWKLNIARNGFSHPLQEGVVANDWYRLDMSSDTVPGGTLCCVFNGDGRLNCGEVKPGTTGYISCRNQCGFFTGGLFDVQFPLTWRSSNWCDYNTWGADVHTHLGDAYCNDPC